MRHVITLLLLFFVCLSTFAQTEKDSVAVYGNVKDSFTHEILKNLHVEIMYPDSTLIDEFLVDQIYRYGGYYHNIDKIGYLYIPRTNCIFRFSKEGYLTQTVNLRKKDIGKRETRISLGEILMKKKPRALEQELGEVTVTASKVRMVVKGDTIVYNADAFQLAEGSMLDGLIKCLSGFELRNGQIRVNGNYVSSLLVNGEDFFRGDLCLPENPLVVVLESVEKPGNLGAILRSADAAKVDAVIVCDPLTDLFNPNLIRSSIGAIFTVPCVACSSADCISFLKQHGIRILTAQLQDSELYYDTDMRQGTAIVMGSEATGLTNAWREAADAHIRIPMLGRLDSLNVSVSAAILMFEAVRQRN